MDPHPASDSENMSILVEFEIETFTQHILYPSLHDFLAKLD